MSDTPCKRKQRRRKMAMWLPKGRHAKYLRRFPEEKPIELRPMRVNLLDRRDDYYQKDLVEE